VDQFAPAETTPSVINAVGSRGGDTMPSISIADAGVTGRRLGDRAGLSKGMWGVRLERVKGIEPSS
jgi:hypothetical protein